MGAKQLAPIKGVNRNFKLNLVTESYFSKNDPRYDLKDPAWHQRYISPNDDTTIVKRALNLIQLTETREIFGLTYKDLIDMDIDIFNYVSDAIYKMAADNLEKRKKEELEHANNNKRK